MSKKTYKKKPNPSSKPQSTQLQVLLWYSFLSRIEVRRNSDGFKWPSPLAAIILPFIVYAPFEEPLALFFLSSFSTSCSSSFLFGEAWFPKGIIELDVGRAGCSSSSSDTSGITSMAGKGSVGSTSGIASSVIPPCWITRCSSNLSSWYFSFLLWYNSTASFLCIKYTSFWESYLCWRLFRKSTKRLSRSPTRSFAFVIAFADPMHEPIGELRFCSIALDSLFDFLGHAIAKDVFDGLDILLCLFLFPTLARCLWWFGKLRAWWKVVLQFCIGLHHSSRRSRTLPRRWSCCRWTKGHHRVPFLANWWILPLLGSRRLPDCRLLPVRPYLLPMSIAAAAMSGLRRIAQLAILALPLRHWDLWRMRTVVGSKSCGSQKVQDSSLCSALASQSESGSFPFLAKVPVPGWFQSRQRK